MEVMLERFLSVLYVIALFGSSTWLGQIKENNEAIKEQEWLMFVTAWV